MRQGLGWAGVAHLQQFVRNGGLLVTTDGHRRLSPCSSGFTPGVSLGRPQKLKIVGSVVRSKMVDDTSPIAYGYTTTWRSGASTARSSTSATSPAGAAGASSGGEMGQRPTGRGTLEDARHPAGTAGRGGARAAEGRAVAGRAADDRTAPQRHQRDSAGDAPARRAPVRRRQGAARRPASFEGGNEIAQHAAVIDVPVEKGHVVLFSNNPIWRGETHGSYFLVFNAILNYDDLDAGRTWDER